MSAIDAIDMKRVFKEFYNPSMREISVVDVPVMNFFMVDGHGDPNTSAEYVAALEALYGLSYTIKFKVKRGGRTDFSVMPLEGLWWVPNMVEFSTADKSAWDWTMMISQPDIVTPDLVDEALQEVREKKGSPALDKARFEPFHEGISVQIMYRGPYSGEGPTIERLHSYIRASGHSLRGKHHEIYLGDPRRSAPEKLRTIIRQPME